ncbi:RPO41 [[Candida] subhashii]|uniref:DNA-directed RNA polymerase n=1 Tax=[Candida] subhashii TaxID=561895 RepID=A0A8J5QMI3_9ASCO|nr:RPO41 [[Candida] subhashii]KAG7664254.1 RPO41 [[Candida] subhashii]
MNGIIRRGASHLPLRNGSSSVLRLAIRHNSEVAAVASPSPSPSPETTETNETIKMLLEDLKGRDTSSKREPSIFSNITNIYKKKITPDQTKFGFFSSPHDDIRRNPFQEEIEYLKPIFESYLYQGNFKKSRGLLVSLAEVLKGDREELNSLCNKFLHALSSSYQLQKLRDEERNLVQELGFVPDARTDAIFLEKRIQDDDVDLETYFSKRDPREIKKLLRNIDILESCLEKIFDCKCVGPSHIPDDLLPVYEEYVSKRSSFGIESRVEALEKDTAVLHEIDSFNLHVVRHSLLGLRPDPEEVKLFELKLSAIIRDLNDSKKALIKSGNLNYFEMYKLLETDEQRAAYDEALAEFNVHRQYELELRALEGAQQKWKVESEQAVKKGYIPPEVEMSKLLHRWTIELSKDLEEEYERCQQELETNFTKTSVKEVDRSQYAPLLLLVEKEKVAAASVLELFKLNASSGTIGMKVTRACVHIGRAIEIEYRNSLLSKKDAQNLKKIRQGQGFANGLKISRFLRGKLITASSEQIPPWNNLICATLGGMMIEKICKLKITTNVIKNGERLFDSHPAVFYSRSFNGKHGSGYIKFHPDIEKLISNKNRSATVMPQHLPMLVKPNPWTGPTGGGFCSSFVNLVRTRDSPETKAYVKAAASKNNLDEVYKGLNVLGNTPWTVNRKVYDVVSHYWNTQEAFLDIPPVIREPVLPPRPDKDADPDEIFAFKALFKNIINEFNTAKSMRSDQNYRLETARGYLGEKMYFPHSLDFRGRAYPICPTFNHLGSDVTRSLFLFWDGKQLGESGLRWLKIHLANLYGIDKVSLDEREQFTKDNLDKVFASARDPYANDAWWTKADKPFQALSVCFELYEAYKLDDPTKYVCHLPVHQDGSCNGLQHYAALGGDIEGARQVNLLPSDKPQDVYTYVANLVNERVNVGAANGEEEAKYLQGKITRKVVKQTVMTNVYGVTFIGAIEQIKKQLVEHFDKSAMDAHHKHSTYLTRQVFSSLRALFSNAHEIQDWLTESARRISKSIAVEIDSDEISDDKIHSSTVIWTTPLGLPCVQPYRVLKKQMISTALQTMGIASPSVSSAVDAQKQQGGFPPNYIHSLDASHMLMTARACAGEGLSFASVHDSFWTHASDVDTMNRLIREQFVRLHSENLVEHLKEEFDARYKGYFQRISIKPTSVPGNKVRAVRKKWDKELGRSVTFADELYMEQKRQRLLASQNPAEVEKGKKMVTTISVIEKDDVYGLHKPGGLEILVPLQFPEVPKRGEFDLEQIKQSQYFFS